MKMCQCASFFKSSENICNGMVIMPVLNSKHLNFVSILLLAMIK